jgi:hypothetical protein
MLASLAALLLAAGDVRLETSLAAGGGYESNLNHAALGADAVGAGFLSLRGAAGLSLDQGERTGLYAGLRLDRDDYPSLSDLSTTTAGVEASLVRELGDRWAVALAPGASYAWSGDRSRDVAELGGRVTLRVKPVPSLALRAFYGYARGEAEDPVFSSERNRVGASVEWRVAARTYLSLGWAAERGDEVYYRPVAATSQVMRRMGQGPVSSFGDAMEAYSAQADVQTLSPSLEVGLGRAVHLRATYDWRVVRGDAGDFESHAVFGGLVLQR